jgi:hypothetical protein
VHSTIGMDAVCGSMRSIGSSDQEASSLAHMESSTIRSGENALISPRSRSM